VHVRLDQGGAVRRSPAEQHDVINAVSRVHVRLDRLRTGSADLPFQPLHGYR
jgi:hypothetical protein